MYQRDHGLLCLDSFFSCCCLQDLDANAQCWHLVIRVALLRSAGMLKTSDMSTGAARTQLCLPLQAESAGLQFPTVKDFLEYTRNRQMLCFHKLEQPKVSWLEFSWTAYLPATVVKPACYINGSEDHLFSRQLLLVRAENICSWPAQVASQTCTLYCKTLDLAGCGHHGTCNPQCILLTPWPAG